MMEPYVVNLNEHITSRQSIKSEPLIWRKLRMIDVFQDISSPHRHPELHSNIRLIDIINDYVFAQKYYIDRN